jgi:hypothetical protein
MKKQCAVCDTRIQSNVVFKWKRHSDNKVFHVCTLCVEQFKVNDNTVKELQSKSFTTVDQLWD